LAVPDNNCGRAPRIVDNTDIRALPIGPEEAFVLSCIDGISSEEDIASATGFNGNDIQRIINKLMELGAIEFEPLSAERPLERSTRLPLNSSGSFQIGPILEIQQPGVSQHPGAIEGDTARPFEPTYLSSEYPQYSTASETTHLPSGEFALTRRIVRSNSPDAIGADDAATRRRALARKLGHSSAPPTSRRTSSTPPNSGPQLARSEQLRHQDLAEKARRQQLDRYLSLATEAAEDNNLVSAVNSLKVACSLVPDDVELARKLKDMQLRAASAMWREYAERADYEAFEGRLAEATRSYELAALGHPCWRFHERAAYCCINSGGDLKKASEHAKRAVSLAPENIRCRLTLAQVYVAGRLKQSALAELERALALDPQQETIRNYIRSVKRGEI